MESRNHFLTILKQGEGALENLAADKPTAAATTKALNACEDLELMFSSVKGRPESEMIASGIKEYHLSLCQATCANYRSAFSGLRLSAELFLASIYFSAHEIKFRRWKNGSDDIVWHAIVDKENGILSTNFVTAFDKEFVTDSKPYLSMAEKAYRECSEYVHGNPNAHYGDTLVYESSIMESWIGKAETFRIVFIYSFAARHLRHLDTDFRQKLEPIMRENFGHLPAIQLIYP